LLCQVVWSVFLAIAPRINCQLLEIKDKFNQFGIADFYRKIHGGQFSTSI